VAFESHGTNQSEFKHAQRLLILFAHCMKENPGRQAHSLHVAQQTPPVPRLASTTRGPTDPMCRARRRQSRESRDEPPRGSVRRGCACVGSIPAADKEGGRLLVVELGESLLERPHYARRDHPPISFVRLAMHRELRQRVYRDQVFVVHRHKRVLLQHKHGLPLCAALQVERDRRRVEKRQLAQRRLRCIPFPRLLPDLSPRQYHNSVEARRTIVPAL
jgi:hypothetical protein